MNKSKDLVEKIFGRLTVIEKVGSRNSIIYWKCVCVCGNFKEVSSSNLRNGHVASCGCLKRDRIIEANTKHGKARRLEKHDPIYKIWAAMKRRCKNPNDKFYHCYGGRGIEVCAEWENFDIFLNDMGHPKVGESLDRIDNDGPYCKENCRWSDAKTQGRHTRHNRFVEYKGEILACSAMAEKYNIPYKKFMGRLYLGWTIQEAIEG